MAGISFQSKLAPHIEVILLKRRQRKTWNHIQEHLESLGCKTSIGNLHAFVKRYRRRPYALGQEPDGFQQQDPEEASTISQPQNDSEIPVGRTPLPKELILPPGTEKPKESFPTFHPPHKKTNK